MVSPVNTANESIWTKQLVPPIEDTQHEGQFHFKTKSRVGFYLCKLMCKVAMADCSEEAEHIVQHKSSFAYSTCKLAFHV
jgi:hypothetical protein